MWCLYVNFTFDRPTFLGLNSFLLKAAYFLTKNVAGLLISSRPTQNNKWTADIQTVGVTSLNISYC